MRSYFVRVIALFVCAASVVAFAGAPAANAAPSAHASSFVGDYSISFTIGSSRHINRGLMTVNADGTADDHLGHTAQWSNKGKTFTLTFSGSTTQVFVAKQNAKGLSSKKHPGTYTNDGVPGGTWWGVKQAA